MLFCLENLIYSFIVLNNLRYFKDYICDLINPWVKKKIEK